MSNTVSKTVTDQELNAMAYQESKGDPNIAAIGGTSTALGLFQFLKGTWRDTVRNFRPDVYKAYPNGELLALRKNPGFAIEMGARFTEANRRTVGANCTLGDLYLAHFLGAGKAKQFYRAPMGMNAVQLAGDGPARANKTVFYHKGINGKPDLTKPKTVGEIRAWSDAVMANASKKAGDYVARWYKGPFKIPASRMGLLNEDAANDEPLVKAEEPDDVENVIQRPGLKPQGDYRLYDNQVQLKHMNYNPGGLDGVWGGGTAGALAGFFNDYAPDAIVPTKWQMYDDNYEAIDSVIDKAESEGFRRPVTRARDEADAETVEKVAPEIKPAKTTLWATVSGFGAAVTSTVYKGVEWLMGYQDQAERFGVFGYIDRVPTFVWLALGSAAIAFVIFKAYKTVNKIEEPVTTGERM